ncbi:helix-turn-helix domain-containing protein [Flavobacterium collinsii]|uniref:helix-turn-helix domain-containing protein n=1 Tax=Flavobacterium collinsii TaxID=1114861 RepID=UPI0037580530
MTFGTRLQKLRNEKRMSQKEISIILEVSQTIYGKWESDIFYPTYKNLKKIAAFYKISVEELVDHECNKKDRTILNIRDVDSISSKTIFKLLKKIEKTVSLIKKQTEILGKGKDREEEKRHI